MIKLIYSDDFDPIVGVGAQIVDKDQALKKQASTIFGCDYSDMKPDKDHVGIHVVALGDGEHYPANRNGDIFPKKACEKYHDTFVKFGHVYRHHRNKDPKKSIGIIKASAYNDKMGRIELYIHADKEKAAPELERLEKEGEVPFSMACQVKFDRCSVCNNLRKQAGDDSECEHVRNHLGELRDDGIKVATYNDEPQFFDISFVGRPADRIAWNLKIASSLPVSSVKQAEYEGITAPDELAITDQTALRKLDYLKQLSDYQKQYTGWATKSAAVITTKDKYLWELRKVAASSLDSETIESLRRLPPKLAFSVLGNSGVIMDVPTFFKYAMGPEYDTVKEYIPGVSVKVASIIEDSVDNNDCQTICNDTTFDTDLKYRDAKLESKLASAALTNDLKNKILIATIDNKIPNWNIDKRLKVCSNGIIDKLAEKYAAYELSAIDAVLQGRNDITQTIALTATHNLQD